MVDFLLVLLYGILPPLLWLFFYLEKDRRPEPKRTIFLIFSLGAFAAILATFFEIIFSRITANNEIITAFISIAMVEEFFKYLFVKIFIYNHKELDEPFDLPLYMIISALGFTTLENIIYLIHFFQKEMLVIGVFYSLLRFLGPIFCHTISSGILGVFWALAILKNKKIFLFWGFFIAIFIHGVFNLAIASQPFMTIPLLIFSALFLFNYFDKLQKMKSVCIIK